MYTVHEIKQLKNGMPVLICDVFPDSVVSEKLKTNIGIFTNEEFAVGQLRYCFGEPKTRMIMLRTKKNFDNIKYIEFE